MLVTNDGARVGSIAGASGDAGTEYRRGVAAYAIACGLAGVAIDGLGFALADARVTSVALETDDPIDDVRIAFTSGYRALVQAKRSLNGGTPLKNAVAQWVQAAKQGLDPSRDRLVIAAGSFSGPMGHLREVLNRERTDHPGTRTAAEAQEIARVEGMLGDLTGAERALVMKCAVLWELPVESPEDTAAQNAIGHLRHVVFEATWDSARLAWLGLLAAVGNAARLRGGYDLAGWQSAIRRTGVEFAVTGASPSVALETSARAIDGYLQNLIRRGSQLELRALGADLPNLPLDSADANILVGIDPSDSREESDLLWAFLRRVRVVLTGLPGGGKSTALRHLAGQLASDPTMPFPVLVSLRDERAAVQSATGFRDRLVQIAVRDEKVEDRAAISAEIDRRLSGSAPIALLLDGLDETYDKRNEVVHHVDDLMMSLPDGVSVLLATRDVAYAQAETLGWADLRLRPPTDTDAIVIAVLGAAAERAVEEAAARPAWIETRRAWVAAALAQEKTLRETPLFPVLLALLSAGRLTADLPRQRARILEAVIRDVVAKREAHRHDGRPLGTLEGTAKQEALFLAFCVEGSEIVASGGSLTATAVRAAVSLAIGTHWGLPSGQADAAAADATRLFDESGIFVFTGSAEVVVPRIALFAEIGDAIRITEHPAEAKTWVASHLATGQLEALVLAATLSQAVAVEAALAFDRDTGNVELARVITRMVNEGVALGTSAMSSVAATLIGRLDDGTREGWRCWGELLDLPLPTELHNKAVAAATRVGADYGTFARGSLLLRFPPVIWMNADYDVLRELLALRSLRRLPSGTPFKKFDLGDALSDRGLAHVQVEAAEFLLHAIPGTVELVAARARTATTPALRQPLIALLKGRGEKKLVQDLERALATKLGIALPDYLLDLDESNYRNILAVFAEPPAAELSAREITSFDELADLVETLDLNHAGVVHFYRMAPADLREIVKLICDLYGFDPGVVAAEATLLLKRLDRWPNHEPYYALFDNARPRRETSWDDILDVDHAADLLMHLIKLGQAQADLAMCSLWEAPLGRDAEERLRQMVTLLKSSPTHQRLAAIALASLSASPEPQPWLTSDDPVLRRVAAAMMEPSVGGALTTAFRLLLDDIDGHVRQTAVERLVAAAPEDLNVILEDIAMQTNPGWMCLSCRTQNSGETRSCSTDKCFASSPDSAAAARKAIAATGI